MSAFQERLIEDLGHEISDVVIAGEDLLNSPENPDDAVQFAREFRSLLATLEMGIRLLQWNDFASFLSEVGLKFDAAFVLGEEAPVVRTRMKATLKVLLGIYEGFDGMRFSEVQLQCWSADIEKIWESSEEEAANFQPTVVDASESAEKTPSFTAEKKTATQEMLEDTSMLPDEAFIAMKTHSPVTAKKDNHQEFLVAEFLGQEFLFPLDTVRALRALDHREADQWDALKQSGEPVLHLGVSYQWSRLGDFRAKKRTHPEIHKPRVREFVLVSNGQGTEVIEVDRIVGIQRSDIEDVRASLASTDESAKRERYTRLKSQGRLATRWLLTSA